MFSIKYNAPCLGVAGGVAKGSGAPHPDVCIHWVGTRPIKQVLRLF